MRVSEWSLPSWVSRSRSHLSWPSVPTWSPSPGLPSADSSHSPAGSPDESFESQIPGYQRVWGKDELSVTENKMVIIILHQMKIVKYSPQILIDLVKNIKRIMINVRLNLFFLCHFLWCCDVGHLCWNHLSTTSRLFLTVFLQSHFVSWLSLLQIHECYELQSLYRSPKTPRPPPGMKDKHPHDRW